MTIANNISLYVGFHTNVGVNERDDGFGSLKTVRDSSDLLTVVKQHERRHRRDIEPLDELEIVARIDHPDGDVTGTGDVTEYGLHRCAFRTAAGVELDQCRLVTRNEAIEVVAVGESSRLGALVPHVSGYDSTVESDVVERSTSDR